MESGNPGINYGTSTNLLVKNNITLATRSAYLMFDVHAVDQRAERNSNPGAEPGG